LHYIWPPSETSGPLIDTELADRDECHTDTCQRLCIPEGGEI
jgi:hypothetical protein